MKAKYCLNILLIILTFSVVSPAIASPRWNNLLGYTIIHVGTITGYIDKNVSKKDDFEGCDFGRKLIIDDMYTVTCATYSYSYSFRPDVVVLQRGNRLKLIINDDEYDAHQ